MENLMGSNIQLRMIALICYIVIGEDIPMLQN